MDITAQALADRHNERPGHSCEVVQLAAPQMTRASMKKHVSTRRKRGMIRVKVPDRPEPKAGENPDAA